MIALGFSLVFAPSLVLGLVPAILLGFVPTLVLGGYLALTIPVIVLESLPPMEAVRRSVFLMRQELMKGVAIFGFVVLISGVLPLGLQLIVGSGPLTPLLAAIVGSVTLPLAYTANVLLYFTVRARGRVVMAYVMTALMVAVGFSLVFAPSLVLGLVPAILLGFVPKADCCGKG